jgi:cyclophilin family peptidyl-prolyl cis-trans isomerase
MAQRAAAGAGATATPNQANQIQALIEEITGTPVTATESFLGGDERPLAALTPAERNNYYAAYPPTIIESGQSYEAIIRTNKGEMRFRLFSQETPLTVNNFAYLASQGYFDGLIFHRVIENFVAQAGDPTGSGSGGPGYGFEDEISDRTFDQRGYLAMANAGPASNGSQFFITFGPTPQLNGRHSIFGSLIAGDEVLSAIAPRDPSDPAAAADVIERIDIVQVGP